MLFEWRPGIPVDGDLYMLDDHLEDGAEIRPVDILTDPVADSEDGNLNQNEVEVAAKKVTGRG